MQIPDGPFNPVNYSGTQINVWGAPPGGKWPAVFGTGPPTPQYPVQYGYLTEQMIEVSLLTEQMIEVRLLTEQMVEVCLLTKQMIEVRFFTE